MLIEKDRAMNKKGPLKMPPQEQNQIPLLFESIAIPPKGQMNATIDGFLSPARSSLSQ